MIPLKLSLSGFLSYRQPVTLDFTSFDLACISGANGAGKSSLLDAITWALFGQARKRDESLINTACDAAEVTLNFLYEDNTYRVHRVNKRGKSSTVDFFIQIPPDQDGSNSWKTLSERTLRATDSLIEKTLRLDYETFINASFFLQGKADQFATQRPADRKRILSSILGLDIWEVYRERASLERRQQEGEITTLDGRLHEILVELEEENDRKARLAELEKQLAALVADRQKRARTLEKLKKQETELQEQAKMLNILKKQLELTSQNRDRNAALLEERLEEYHNDQKMLADAADTEAAYQTWLDTRTKLSEWEQIAEQFRKSETRRHEPSLAIEAQGARLTQELSNLESTLKTLQAAEERLPELKEELQSAQKAAKAIQKNMTGRSHLEEDIRKLHQDQADARAENPRLRDEMKELKERINQLDEVEGADCPLCGQSLSPEEREELLSQLNQQGTSLGDRFRENEALLNDFDTRQKAMEEQLTQLQQLDDNLRDVTRQIDQINDRLKQIETLRKDWDKNNARHMADIKTALKEKSYAPEAHSQLAIIDTELKALGYDAAAHEAVRQAELDGRKAETAFSALNSARAALTPLAREIEGLQDQLKNQTAEVERLQQDHDDAAARYAAAETQLPDLHAAEADLLNAQELENRLRMDVGAANQKVAVLESQRERQASLSKEREQISTRIEQLKVLERSFGKDGVPALLIEQALPEIEEQANQTLARLSNNTMSVQFITQREFKDASREDKKETLDIRISDGSGGRDYEMFSGGEAFRVNFAIRLALSRVLAQRAGARLQTLVIDEGFSSQDAQGRQRLIEAINLVRPDFAKILVITHLDELKDAFSTRIEVEKTPLGSTLTVI